MEMLDANATTAYVCGFNFTEAIDFLANNQKIFVWFKQNGLMTNSGKSFLLFTPTKNYT